MNQKDIRWIQRASHFNKALTKLRASVELARQRQLSELESQGLIKGFEYTHELAWNTLKDYYEEGGVIGMRGSIDATRVAFREGLIENGAVWMDMIRSRNLTSHTYDEDTAEKVVSVILKDYFEEFQKLQIRLEQLKQNEA